MNIYSIKNEKLSFFNRPMYFESTNECLAYLTNVLMSDADRALLGLKDDLALYCLGSIDFVSGIIDARKGFPHKLMDLREIFESIPTDRVPQTAKQLQQNIEAVNEKIDKLRKELLNDNN